jgi:hypothetical protein
MRFTQIICSAWNAAGEPKLAVLVATMLSVYNVTTAFTAVLEPSEIWMWNTNRDHSGVDNWLGAPLPPSLIFREGTPASGNSDPIRLLLWQQLTFNPYPANVENRVSS